jgi:hypothetical protein
MGEERRAGEKLRRKNALGRLTARWYSPRPEGEAMKRIAAVCLLLAGCSSAPVADLMDWLRPGQLEPAPGFHGGVGAQTQIAAPLPPTPEAPPPAGSPVPPTDLGR